MELVEAWRRQEAESGERGGATTTQNPYSKRGPKPRFPAGISPGSFLGLMLAAR